MGNSGPVKGVWLGAISGIVACLALFWIIHENWPAAHRVQVWENVRLAYGAVTAFQADNDGVLPPYVKSKNQLGYDVFHYLPEGRPLLNPFTQRRSEPSDSTNAGSIRYSPSEDGFEVIGYGPGGGELVRLPRDAGPDGIASVN